MSPERKKLTKPLTPEEFLSLKEELESLPQNLTEEAISTFFGKLALIQRRLTSDQRSEIMKTVKEIADQLGIKLKTENNL